MALSMAMVVTNDELKKGRTHGGNSVMYGAFRDLCMAGNLLLRRRQQRGVYRS